ncbi:DUF4255 domain-containing protein [Amycolatopsis sp. NPDC059021]|uniref:DUF4255 domain-containing protein n=1 Tax=Amycolatopsis sp. NPDC059021 TaxID=3346704 RepID=UPI003672A58D
MSDARAIEAVTETLQMIIQRGVSEVRSGALVRVLPPHEVDTGQPEQVNLYLYQVDVAAGLRNEDPLDVLPGETADPALPLVLHYLLTPYVHGGDDLIAHRMLGGAVRAVHEHPVLSRADLRHLPHYSDVDQQLDRVRLTWQPLEEKDIFSLWSAFQTPYRLSAAFEARVVLIDSRRQRRTPVPVLTRGKNDTGPVAGGSVASPFPELTDAVPAHGQPSAKPGETVTLRGKNLTADTVEVVLRHPLVPAPVVADVGTRSATEVHFGLTHPGSDYPAGLWSVALRLTSGTGTDRSTTVTNDVPLAIAPTVTAGFGGTVNGGPKHTFDLDVTCTPVPLPGQPVFLLLGSHTAAPVVDTQHPRPLDSPRFHFTGVEPGRYPARLRVGGVDSQLVNRSGERPVFDGTQVVTVT